MVSVWNEQEAQRVEAVRDLEKANEEVRNREHMCMSICGTYVIDIWYI